MYVWFTIMVEQRCDSNADDVHVYAYFMKTTER